jgi:outer membrane biosynthesis protein TonB
MTAPTAYYDDRSFLEKHGMTVLIGIVVLLAAVVALRLLFFKSTLPQPVHVPEIVVHLERQPLPPPPPVIQRPPPPHPPPMVEITKVDTRPPTPPVVHAAAPGVSGPKAGPLSDDGTNGNNGNGDTGVIGDIGSNGFGFYAGQVGDLVRAVLSSNPRTSKASFHARLHVWLDRAGRITRVTLTHSNDDSAVDTAIQNDVLVGQMVGAPPQGMPMPIVMNIEAKRPN